jgi:hypothetical protein
MAQIGKGGTDRKNGEQGEHGAGGADCMGRRWRTRKTRSRGLEGKWGNSTEQLGKTRIVKEEGKRGESRRTKCRRLRKQGEP